MKKHLLLLFLFVFQLGFSLNELSETDKLATTCKVWGFLKYYHPSVASGKFNWDEELYSILPKVEDAKTKEEFSIVLETWIDKLGEVPKIKIVDKLPKESYFYKNLDLSWTQNNSLFSKSLSGKLKWIEENRFQGEQFYISINVGEDGYPLAENEFDEFEGVPSLQNEKTPEEFTWTEKKYRLLALFRYWNIIEYFAPNKYLIDKDWSTCLQDILPRISNPKDELSYHYALLEMVCNLNDSHASYYFSKPTLPELNYKYILPFEVKIIDNYFVVSKLYNDALCVKNGIEIGDAITILDGKTVQDYIVLYKNKTPASNTSYLLSQISKLKMGFLNKEIEIEIKKNKDKVLKKIELNNPSNRFKDIERLRSKIKYKILDNNIAYLNLENIYNKDLPTIFSDIINTKGVIVDIRNYPNQVIDNLVKFFSPKEMECARQIHADLKYPGRFIWEKVVTWGEENPNNYKGKIVVLVNEATMSQAETTAMSLQVNKNAIVIGSQTAGADGWNAPVKVIYFHFEITFTGKGYFYPDGREVQRIGIVPDIIVKPTIDGIRGMKDEVLNKAIEYLNETP